jgi:hypothetical protein
MGDIGFRFYFIDGDKIMRVGLDAKCFPKLAGRQVTWITVIFQRSNKEIMSIRFDPANIDPGGNWNCDLEHKWAAATMDKIFRKVLVKEESDKVTSLRPRLLRIKLTDYQKEVLRNRIDRDFGPGSWNRITPEEKALLWSTGRTFEIRK